MNKYFKLFLRFAKDNGVVNKINIQKINNLNVYPHLFGWYLSIDANKVTEWATFIAPMLAQDVATYLQTVTRTPPLVRDIRDAILAGKLSSLMEWEISKYYRKKVSHHNVKDGFIRWLNSQ